MSYDHPNRLRYGFGNTDFGSGSAVELSIRGPKGKAGRLYDYGVMGSLEAFNGDSTVPSIAVGTNSDPDAYGDELSLNGLAANDAKSVRTTYREEEAGFSTYMLVREIPADTEIYLTCATAVGTPTGQAAPFAIIDWQS